MSFKKILTVLNDYYRPEWDLIKGGRELVRCFQEVGLSENEFRSRRGIRLAQLDYLRRSNSIDDNLYWVKNDH